MVTGGELAVGLGLMLGILGRVAALGGLGMSLLPRLFRRTRPVIPPRREPLTTPAERARTRY